MTDSLLRNVATDMRNGRPLDASVVEELLDAVIASTDKLAVAELLRAWQSKGIDAEEILQFAKVLRARMKRINSRHERVADIVGTGGSEAKSFNVSTASAFVVAGAGVPVAKHGNKAATSSSGSADVLAALGVDSAALPKIAETYLNDIGLCFMFAPNHHRLSPVLGEVRRGLGFPTIFNCVGPLCNPASAPHQVIGVWDKSLLSKMATALAGLGTVKSWVVHGENGLDEICLNGPTYVTEVVGNTIREFTIEPSYFSIPKRRTQSVRSVDSSSSAKLIRSILTNEACGSEAEDMVVVNSAAALHLTGESNPTAAAIIAKEAIRSGCARRKLELIARSE